MTCKITVNQLKHWQANPPQRQVYYSDDQSPLMVRHNTDSSLAFCARRRRRGKREWKTFGRWPELGLADARQMARLWKSGVQVKSPVEESRSRATLGDVLDSYFEIIRLYATTWKALRSIVRREVPPDWLGRPADSFETVEFRNLFVSMAQRAGYQTNKLQKVLSAAYNRAIEANVVRHNPLHKMRKLVQEKARKNVLDFEQIRKLWLACDAEEQPLVGSIQLLLLTGCRLREILHARWDYLGSDAWLKIPENKSRRPHQVFLCEQAREIVMGLPSRGVSPYLFPGRDPGRPKKNNAYLKERIAERADIGDWQLRDLRSTFLSRLVENCSIRTVIAKVCANHSLPGITDTNYIERLAYYPDAKEAWIAYGRLIEDIVEGRVGKVVEMPLLDLAS